MGHKIGYARVSTADQNPQLQFDALTAEDCLKTYVDTATGTKTDRPSGKPAWPTSVPATPWSSGRSTASAAISAISSTSSPPSNSAASACAR